MMSIPPSDAIGSYPVLSEALEDVGLQRAKQPRRWISSSPGLYCVQDCADPTVIYNAGSSAGRGCNAKKKASIHLLGDPDFADTVASLSKWEG